MTSRTHADLPRRRTLAGVFRPRGRSWILMGVLWLVLAMALAMALGGCSEEDGDVEELSGYFGPGSGGVAVSVPDLVTYNFLKLDNTPLGSLEADTAPVPPGPPGYYTDSTGPGTLLTLANLTDGLSLDVTRILGRADTPCRFTAALLARDYGFVILAAGDRINANDLEFHQVNLVNGSIFKSFYCTLLKDNVGIQIEGTSIGGNRLAYLQVHHVLNSISK